MPGTKRPCIEVATGRSFTGDPVSHFAHTLRLMHGGTQDIEDYNRCMLDDLMNKNQIPKSNIVWRGDEIFRIYNFKLDDSGKMKYINTNVNTSPPKKASQAHSASISKAEIDMFKRAIVQQIAITP